MLINNKVSEFCTLTKKPCLYKEESQEWQDESNHHHAEQESLSVQLFKQTKITFALRKNGGSMPSGLGSRLFPVVRLASQADDNLVRVLI